MLPDVDGEWASLPPVEFGFAGTDLRRELVDAVLRGEKTATAGLLVDYEREGEPLPRPGERFVVLDFDDRPVGVVETTEVRVVRMADVDLQFALEEGEGPQRGRLAGGPRALLGRLPRRDPP